MVSCLRRPAVRQLLLLTGSIRRSLTLSLIRRRHVQRPGPLPGHLPGPLLGQRLVPQFTPSAYRRPPHPNGRACERTSPSSVVFAQASSIP